MLLLCLVCLHLFSHFNNFCICFIVQLKFSVNDACENMTYFQLIMNNCQRTHLHDYTLGFIDKRQNKQGLLMSLRHCLYQVLELLCALNMIIQILIIFTLIRMQITQSQPQNIDNQHCRAKIQPLSSVRLANFDFKSSIFSAFWHEINSQMTWNLPNLEDLCQGKRQVKPKMITRLVTWLQKLCKETLEFSTRTLETASRILVAFLGVVDQAVCNLQLLGCACLYLSSKISETTIVAAQSYVACSMNIFTEKDLMSKEAQIYKILDGNTNFLNLYDIYQFITHGHSTPITNDSHQNLIQKYLSYYIKDVNFLALNPCDLLCAILHFIVDLNIQPTNQDIRNCTVSISEDRKK